MRCFQFKHHLLLLVKPMAADSTSLSVCLPQQSRGNRGLRQHLGRWTDVLSPMKKIKVQ